MRTAPVTPRLRTGAGAPLSAAVLVAAVPALVRLPMRVRHRPMRVMPGLQISRAVVVVDGLNRHGGGESVIADRAG